MLVIEWISVCFPFSHWRILLYMLFRHPYRRGKYLFLSLYFRGQSLLVSLYWEGPFAELSISKASSQSRGVFSPQGVCCLKFFALRRFAETETGGEVRQLTAKPAYTNGKTPGSFLTYDGDKTMSLKAPITFLPIGANGKSLGNFGQKKYWRQKYKTLQNGPKCQIYLTGGQSGKNP